MKKSTLASLALLCAAVALPAHANTNGVYVQVADDFYGFKDETWETRGTGHSTGIFKIVTVSHKASYACNGKSSFTKLPEGAGFRYCSRSAEVKLVWKREITEETPSPIPGPPIGSSEVRYLESYHVVDDRDYGHCNTGEAVIWDVGAWGAENSYATMRDYCQYCAYTGGDCE